MSYFPDLSPYTYGSPTGVRDVHAREVLNVGWLEKWWPFDVERPSEDFVAALKAVATSRRTNVTRGPHYCQLCRQARGSAEIRVDGNGVTYAAPELIVHYVEEHGYKPPAEFVAAVMCTRPPA